MTSGAVQAILFYFSDLKRTQLSYPKNNKVVSTNTTSSLFLNNSYRVCAKHECHRFRCAVFTSQASNSDWLPHVLDHRSYAFTARCVRLRTLNDNRNQLISSHKTLPVTQTQTYSCGKNKQIASIFSCHSQPIYRRHDDYISIAGYATN